MKNSLLILQLVLLSLIGLWAGLWWFFAIPAAIHGYLSTKNLLFNFVIPFLVIFIIWFVLTYWKDGFFGQPPSELIASLMGINSPFLIILLAGLIPGLIAGILSLGVHMLINRSGK